MSDSPDRSTLIWTFWCAALLSTALPHLPFGQFVLYPFALMATWAHEMGHGLTAIAVGGTFESLVLFADLGGFAYSTRPDVAWAHAAIAAGGLLTPAFAGGLVVLLGARARTATWVLDGLGLLLVLSALLWVRNGFGFAATISRGLVSVGLGHVVDEFVEIAVTQFVGIRLCLESLSDVDYMFTQYFTRGGERHASDTQLIAEHLLLPYWTWGALIALLSVAILATSFYIAWLRPAPG